ncbi:phage tail length tape measure family protein [Sinorhizobium fredii]|uniref:phage tail length tape measure family protein n=1 Tax=Rhizobium fredii TaxID=380 RepID=UPI003CE5B61D
MTTTKTLSLVIDPSGAQTGGRVVTRTIEDVATSAAKAERAIDSFSSKGTKAIRDVGEATRESARHVKDFSMTTEQALTTVSRNASLATSQSRMLAFQLNDVFQSMALGMPVQQVLLQQGPQLAQIYGAGEGGIGRAFKETAAMATSLVARLWPVAAAAAGVYGAYKLVTSYSAEARLQVDDLTRSMAAQAQSAGALKGSIADFVVLREGLVEAMGVKGALGDLITLQGNYSAAIGESAGIQTRTSSSIVSDLRREYEAKRSLLEIESRLQDAKLATMRADLEVKKAQLREEIGGQVFTRGDLEAQGFSDPRIGRFTQLPDSVTGLEKLNSTIANSPLALEIAKMSAELALSENQAQKLKNTLSQTFGGAAVSSGLDRLSTLGTSFTSAAQGASSLATSVSQVVTSAQTANTGIVNVTESLAQARRQSLASLEQTSTQLRGMKTELADIQATLANAAKTPLSTVFGDGVKGSAATDAVSRAASSIQKVFQALEGGQITAAKAHESLELIRQSLYQIGGDPRVIDGFINALINGNMRVRDLEASIKSLSASIMGIPNRVISIGIQEYTVPSAGGGSTGVRVHGGNADFSYSQYQVGGGKTVGVSAGNGSYGGKTASYYDSPYDLGILQDMGYQISGARAAGGPVSAGGTYLVGENGPELLNMSGAGNVTNANSTASILSGGRDALSLIEDHLFNVVQELRIHTNYWETAESNDQEMIACLKALKSASGSVSYSGGASYSGASSSRGSYSGGSSGGGSSHLDPYSAYYFNAARNFAGTGGGRYDPVADAMLNGNTAALNGVSGGPTQGIARLLSGHNMPSLLDRLKRQVGFANNGQIMAGEDQKVEFFKRNKERVIIVDDNRVSDQRGAPQSSRSERPVQVTINQYGVDQRDQRSRQAQADEIRRVVQQAVRS